MIAGDGMAEFSRLLTSSTETPFTDDSDKNFVSWFHLSGTSHEGLEVLQKKFRFDPDLTSVVCQLTSKPGVDWHQSLRSGEPSVLVVSAHELEITDTEVNSVGSDQTEGGLLDFHVQQVTFFCIPELNTLISVHANPEDDSFEPIFKMLACETAKLRVGGHWAQLLMVCLDAMVDELYPVLDLYGDALEGLDLAMVRAKHPDHSHVHVAHKIKRRIQRMRRYSWNCRQLMCEIKQNQYGVIPLEDGASTAEQPAVEKAGRHVLELVNSIQLNSCEMSDMCEAWINRCTNVDSFYERYSALLFFQRAIVVAKPT